MSPSAAPAASTEPDACCPHPPPPPCPRCQGTHIRRHGSFACKNGARVPRFRCMCCGRTFNPLTGTPLAYLKKRDLWPSMLQCMEQSWPVRQTARLLGVHIETAFRWRHRLLAAVAALPGPVLSGSVEACLAFFKYSEKGRRPEPRPAWPPPCLTLGGHPFVFRKAVAVLLVHGQGRRAAAAIAGRGRPGAPELERCLSPLVLPGTLVWAGYEPHLEAACQRLGLPYRDGLAEYLTHLWRVERLRDQLYTWVRRFRGVATRHLAHYLAWFTTLFRYASKWARRHQHVAAQPIRAT